MQIKDVQFSWNEARTLSPRAETVRKLYLACWNLCNHLQEQARSPGAVPYRPADSPLLARLHETRLGAELHRATLALAALGATDAREPLDNAALFARLPPPRADLTIDDVAQALAA